MPGDCNTQWPAAAQEELQPFLERLLQRAQPLPEGESQVRRVLQVGGGRAAKAHANMQGSNGCSRLRSRRPYTQQPAITCCAVTALLVAPAMRAGAA